MKHLGFLLLALLLCSQIVVAQDFHAYGSYQKNLTQADLAGTELTLIAGPYLGLRYSHYPAISLGQGSRLESQIATEWATEADLKIPSLLWLVDYQNYKGRGTSPFDFLTAYLGLGFAQATTTHQLSQTEISYDVASSSYAYQSSTSEETDNANIALLSFGFFGAQSFISIDARFELLYSQFQGYDRETSLQQLRFVVALGFGY